MVNLLRRVDIMDSYGFPWEKYQSMAIVVEPRTHRAIDPRRGGTLEERISQVMGAIRRASRHNQ
jgi:hypothetical protein